MIILRDALESCNDSIEKELYGQFRQPEHLYHYTDSIGFQGIIESNTLRMTHAAYLNDASELVYARNLAKSGVIEHFSANALDNEIRDVILNEIDDKDNRIVTAVTCFSAEGNLLNQWRDYGGRQSYCLEFIYPNFVDEGETVGLLPIICDEMRQKALISKHLESVTNVYRTSQFQDALSEAEEEDKTQTLMFIAHGITRLCGYFKHSAFSLEREFRMVWQGIPVTRKWSYAPSMYGLTPFFLRSFTSKAPLRSVMIGPCRFPDHATVSAIGFLRDNEYFDTPIVRSYVPMRSL